MPVLKFNQCDYDCGGKKDKRGSFRVYCKRVDPKCSRLPREEKPKPTTTIITQEHRMTSLMADMRQVIADSKVKGESQPDLTHIFKDYKPIEVQNAILLLLNDGQIKEIYPQVGEKRYITTDPRIIPPGAVKPKYRAEAKPAFPYPGGPLPHLPEYIGATPKNAEVTVTKTEIEKAITRARQHAPGEWQAEILEIALIPQMQKYLSKQNPHYTLTRVVNGYVLHPYNSPERPYTGVAYDGFRRNFYEEPLHGLRSLIWAPEESLNQVVINEWLSQDKIRFHNV